MTLIGLDGKAIPDENISEYASRTAERLRLADLAAYSLVGIFLPRTAPSAALILAVLRGDLTGMSLDRRYTPAELGEACRSFPFRAIVTQAAAAESFRSFYPAARILSLPAIRGEPLAVVLLEPAPAPELREKDVRWLLLTSGSTGRPKAVMISGRNLRERAAGESRLFGLGRGDRILNLLSFAHDLGFNQLLSSAEAGATLAMLPSFSPAELALQLAREPFAGMTATPLVWRNLLRALREGAEPPRTQPRYLTISGGSVTPAELDELRALFPRTRWILTYGQTETFRSLADGLPIPGVSVSLRDSAGRECSAGEVGELFHAGTGAMEGYFGDPALTAGKLRAGGIATGDLFRRGPQGNFEFVGRSDEMIKRDDHRLFPGEVENALLAMDGVANAACIAQGEKLVAFVAPQPGTALTPEALRTLCRARLMRHKVPDIFVVLNGLPQLDTGKVDRAELRRQGAECL